VRKSGKTEEKKREKENKSRMSKVSTSEKSSRREFDKN